MDRAERASELQIFSPALQATRNGRGVAAYDQCVDYILHVCL